MTSGPDFSDINQVATRTIGYNAQNMPAWIEHTKGGNTVRTDFLYDGDGVRAKKLVSSGSTTYYIGEHFEKKDGVAIKYIFAGDMRIAKVTSSTRYYYHKDHLGSSTAMTDASGVKVEATEYMPFGHMRNHRGTVVTDYKFTDQELDPETGLYNYVARLYDTVIGRFISPDPIVPAPFDPQTLNRYSYVNFMVPGTRLKVTSSDRYYYHKDHLGSSTAMTDSSGVKVETTEYMPFGHMREHTGAVVSDYKFTDQELDPETGLYNYLARLYDPVIGRFITADPIVPAPFDPQTLNRYSYCRNNPLIYVDPSGHSFFGDIADAIGNAISDAIGWGREKASDAKEAIGRAAREAKATFDRAIREARGAFYEATGFGGDVTGEGTPTHISPTGGGVTSGYGTRIDPITGEEVEHRGIDFEAPGGYGSDVHASADGTVVGTRSGQTSESDVPNGLTVDEGDTGSYYGHVNPSVEVGDTVEQGDVIGTVDDSGRTTGPHVHYQGYDEDWNVIDPTDRF